MISLMNTRHYKISQIKQCRKATAKNVNPSDVQFFLNVHICTVLCMQVYII